LRCIPSLPLEASREGKPLSLPLGGVSLSPKNRLGKGPCQSGETTWEWECSPGVQRESLRSLSLYLQVQGWKERKKEGFFINE